MCEKVRFSQIQSHIVVCSTNTKQLWDYEVNMGYNGGTAGGYFKSIFLSTC